MGTGQSSRGAKIFGRDRTLLLEGGAAEIEALPAAVAPRSIDRRGLGLLVGGQALVDTGVIGPVGIDRAAAVLQLAQNWEGLPPGDSQEIDPQPEEGVGVAGALKDRQQVLFGEVMVDQEQARRPGRDGYRDIAVHLVLVLHMDHRQDRGAR